MKTKLTVIVAVALVCGCIFWNAIFSWLSSLAGRVGVQAATAAQLPGVPANTIAQAAKAARALRKASIAYDLGIVVDRNHVKSVALQARADAIDELIAKIASQPVTGKPVDATKKIPRLRALREFAKLDDPSVQQDIAKLDEAQ